MSDCIICDKKFEKNILYENDEFIIMLAVSPAVTGHIQIFSKQHYPILETVPEETISKIMSAANKVSMVLFEALKVHGTNLIINNGVPAGQKIPHFAIDILPRRSDDNLKIDWELKQATPEALDSAYKILEEGMSKPEQKPIVMDEKKTIVLQSSSPSEKKPETKAIESQREIRPSTPTQSNDSEEIEENPTNYYHQLFNRIP